MSSLKLYTDTHINKQVAVQLRRHGVDIVRCEEVGLADIDDVEHFNYAAAEQRAIITNDQDFLKLAQQRQSEKKDFSGIFFCQSHVQGEAAIGIIVNVCLFYHEALIEGAGTFEKDIKNQIIYIG